MSAVFVCVAAATLGWHTGWERSTKPGETGMVYVIQLDEPAIESLRNNGKYDGELGSDIPTDIGEVRAFRIVMGSVRPKRELPPVKPPKPVEKPAPIPLKVAEKPAPPKPAETPMPATDTPAEPWMPLMLTSLALFASIGANLFLGWIAWGFRRRCQTAAL